MRALGALALLFYAAHATCNVARGEAWDLLWACNVAMPMLGIGCLLESPRLTASALMFLTYGTPMWLLDLATGASMVPTSPLVHVCGPIIGVLAVRRLGWPPRAWVFACGLTALLLLVSRLGSPPEANVNLAFRVHGGWEHFFPSHLVYVAMMWLGSAIVFFLTELVARRLLGPRRARDLAHPHADT